MNRHRTGRYVRVPLTTLVEMAIEWWRLDCWLADEGNQSQTAVPRRVARLLSEFLKEKHIDVMDITGALYDPGLAVEVVDTVSDPNLAEGDATIDETVSPIVRWRGAVIRQGQVVTRRGAAREPTGGEGVRET